MRIHPRSWICKKDLIKQSAMDYSLDIVSALHWRCAASACGQRSSHEKDIDDESGCSAHKLYVPVDTGLCDTQSVMSHYVEHFVWAHR